MIFRQSLILALSEVLGGSLSFVLPAIEVLPNLSAMSKKRISHETSPYDQAIEEDPILQHDDDCKRVKLTSLSDTTLEDLPLELIHRILVRAIASEVNEMHLAKSVWKEKADLVMSRLKTVCPHWCNILTTDFFQSELYSTLDCAVEKMVRLEIVHQSTIHSSIYGAITIKDDLFVLCKDDQLDAYVVVYDLNNLTGMRDFIDLALLEPRGITACSVSNCLYVLNVPIGEGVIVERITKEDEHKFTISPLITGRWKPTGIAIAANANIILYKQPNGEQEAKVDVYDANGVLQRSMQLPTGMKWIRDIVPVPSGNLLISSAKDKYGSSTKLTEMDMKGTVLRQHEFSVGVRPRVCLMGPSGRILIFKRSGQFELLDKEFHLLNAICPQLEEDKYRSCTSLHCSGERNELVTIMADEREAPLLIIYQFTEN